METNDHTAAIVTSPEESSCTRSSLMSHQEPRNLVEASPGRSAAGCQ